MSNKWYGKIIFRSEGCEIVREFSSELEAKAYVQGCKDCEAVQDPDYVSDSHSYCYDQIEPTEVN